MFIKICGITSVADACMAASAGCQAIGLNFYAQSPRVVDPARAREIIQNLPPFVEPVGVFANSAVTEVRQIANSLGLRTLQLHGGDTAQLVAELREFSVIAAVPVRDDSSVSTVQQLCEACAQTGRTPSAILLDAHDEAKLGGTGRTAPWPIARSIVDQCPLPILLAGGLTAKNVAEAIRVVQPWGVDAASGLEVAPGRKESYKVRSFVDAIRRASTLK